MQVKSTDIARVRHLTTTPYPLYSVLGTFFAEKIIFLNQNNINLLNSSLRGMYIVSVDTVSFFYEGDAIYNNTQYVIKAKQRDINSKVEVVIEDFDDIRNRFGKEFDDVFEFFEWLKSK